MFSLKFFFPQFCGDESRMIRRVSQIGSTVEGQLGKMAKNCMKMAKSAFLAQNSGRDVGETSQFSG